MRYKVQLPDYPCHHVVTGFAEGRGAGGAKLLLAEATAVIPGMREHKTTDLVSLMLLHDAVRIRQVGPYKTNRPNLYGSAAGQRRAISRIAGAVVEEIESTTTETSHES